MFDNGGYSFQSFTLCDKILFYNNRNRKVSLINKISMIRNKGKEVETFNCIPMFFKRKYIFVRRNNDYKNPSTVSTVLFFLWFENMSNEVGQL